MCLAVCDVDRKHLESGNHLAQSISGHPADMYEDYRKVLDRKDIEAVVITTPDHWHSKIAIEAMQAGKDVYCEKPLTLTIDEGKKICQVQKQTNRVFQVGTQQRSEFDARTIARPTTCRPRPSIDNFCKRWRWRTRESLGNIKKVTCSIGECDPCAAAAESRRARRIELGNVAGSNAAGRFCAGRNRVPRIPSILPAARITNSAGGTNTPAAS